jgi:hypothetical protein
MAKEGRCQTASGINREAFYSSTFPHYFKLFLKDPDPLNSKNLFYQLNNLTWGVTEPKGVWR